MNLRTATGYVHISPSPAYYAQHQLQAPTDNSSYMTYCGGPVMLTNTTYAIYWAPSGHPITATYQTIINRYFNDVGGSPLYGILLQYYQEPPRTFIQSQSNFGGAYVYTATYPHAGTIANPLTDADIQNAVTATIQAKGWRTGLSAVYLSLRRRA